MLHKRISCCKISNQTLHTWTRIRLSQNNRLLGTSLHGIQLGFYRCIQSTPINLLSGLVNRSLNSVLVVKRKNRSIHTSITVAQYRSTIIWLDEDRTTFTRFYQYAGEIETICDGGRVEVGNTRNDTIWLNNIRDRFFDRTFTSRKRSRCGTKTNILQKVTTTGARFS